MENPGARTAIEMRFTKPAEAEAEASLEEQRAALVAQAAHLGLKVVDPKGQMPGPVAVRLNGRSTDLDAALELFSARGIRLDDVTKQRATRGLGVTRTATLNMAHPDNASTRVDPGTVPEAVAIDRAVARNLARHAKAMLMHLRKAEDLAAEAGFDVDDYRPGSVGEYLHRVGLAVEDFDGWAINTAGRSALRPEDVYANTERWCHAPGGVLPVAPPEVAR